MRISLIALVRLSCLVALSVSAVAVGFSRVVPEVVPFRTPAAPRYFGLNGACFSPPSWRGYLLDAETGELTKPDPAAAAGNSLDFVTCSPWTTDPGRYEFIGRAQAYVGSAQNALFTASSLLRFGPDGEGEFCGPADQSPAVCGRPAWLPGEPAALLLCGGDGRLYRHELGPDRPGEAAAPARRPVTWACPFPGDGPPIVNDPICPPIPALGGKAFVSLAPRVKVDGRPTFGPPEVWWLELDEAGTAVTAAGRLIASAAGPDGVEPVTHQRFANLVSTEDGRVMIAFLGRVTGPSDIRLMVAEVDVNPETGRPGVDPRRLREVAHDVVAMTPPLSPGGRWVYAVGRARDGLPAVERLSLAEATADRHSPRNELADAGN